VALLLLLLLTLLHYRWISELAASFAASYTFWLFLLPTRPADKLLSPHVYPSLPCVHAYPPRWVGSPRWKLPYHLGSICPLPTASAEIEGTNTANSDHVAEPPVLSTPHHIILPLKRMGYRETRSTSRDKVVSFVHPNTPKSTNNKYMFAGTGRSSAIRAREKLVEEHHGNVW
jgi:hypothetical protein